MVVVPNVDLELSKNGDDFLTESIIFSASDLFKTMRQLHNNDYHGGYLCITDPKTGIPYLTLGLGQAMPEKWEKYLEFSMEKARRLAAHPEHVCSAQSRNDQTNQWPGAIRTRKIIISFSGLPWEIDETYCLLLAHVLELISMDEAREIANISGNNKFEEAVRLLFTN